MVVSQAGTHHGLAAQRLSCLFTFRAVLWSLCNHWFVIQRIFGRALASAKIHDMIVSLASHWILECSFEFAAPNNETSHANVNSWGKIKILQALIERINDIAGVFMVLWSVSIVGY